MAFQEKRTLHLVGIGVKHSIAPGMHNFIAGSLGLPWTFYSTECPDIDDLIAIAKAPTTAGLVVTMPYKNTVMSHLDKLDELAKTIGACNNVYYEENDGSRVSHGTNTDWLGIRGCLLEKGDEKSRPTNDKPGIGMIVGAGGASRAAVYALGAQLHCNTIYVINRDDDEVSGLFRAAQEAGATVKLIHVKTEEQAKSLETPYYIVGTVPDFEPQTDAEKNVAALLDSFLGRPEKGTLLDMCFKPRRTRMIKLAERLGWHSVEGTHVIGYQIEEQWRLWAGEERLSSLDREGAWNVLIKAADESPGINF